MDAFFMSIGDYIEAFGSYPTEFPVKHSQVDGVRKKGVWLKWVVGEQKESKVIT